MFVVDAGIHNQPHSAEHFGIKVSVARIWVLIEAQVFTQTLSIQSPSFAIRRIEAVLTKFRKFRQSLCDRNLHVMSWHALVVGRSLDVY